MQRGPTAACKCWNVLKDCDWMPVPATVAPPFQCNVAGQLLGARKRTDTHLQQAALLGINQAASPRRRRGQRHETTLPKTFLYCPQLYLQRHPLVIRSPNKPSVGFPKVYNDTYYQVPSGKMAPKNSTMAERAPTAAETKEDACFGKSPFTSTSMVTLRFKQGDLLNVHPAILYRNPKLALLDTSKQNSWSFPKPPSLSHISRGAGHVLVHYLYTDSYRTLDWTGPTTVHDEAIAKLRTGFEVYATARQFELDRLEELAKEQISLLSKEVDPFTILNVVSEAYPTSTNKDTWFPTYMKAVVKTAFEGSEALPKSEASENEREDGIPTARILLRGAVEIYREMVEALAVKNMPVTLEKPVPVPPRDEENTWGLETANKDKKARYAMEPEPEPYAGPAPEAEPEPEVGPVPDDGHALIPEPSQQEDIVWDFTTAKKSKKDKKDKKKKSKKGAVESEPEPEPAPVPEPTAEKEDNTTASSTAASNTTGAWSIFGVSRSTTTGTPFGGTTNAAAVGGPPGTASPAFTPTTDKEVGDPYHSISFQNNLFMDAYKGWSGEELRLADYSQGHKQGSSAGGGTGASGASLFGKTGFGSSK
ncbi:hypothetical protein B0T26DRAFT_726094 [Lasiosphaeria miniovina]|uniref:BTB domain-containing protein n=1 Tax=Lasiosphaeria miniovina TaxID=1954250 RepID=A0AA40DM40_9PEZI|nr:uncharacterized protein B0T26DRAFT_726094 [Lasiosphaeria miniovina]KAK0706281.1 hypothetical protein B0T26DRAFT_726094 [Lasiosphaeria miniovina]